MDIGKYIGKFLIKNKYCSLPGLGVFDLQKSPARVNSTSSEVSKPSHIITFTPVGSIDDTFASFIAGFENVSISNASNNIKEYCIAVKEEVAKTGKFEIEHLGRLSMSGNKLVFQQASDLDLGFEPAPITPIEVKPASEEPKVEAKPDYSYPPATTTYRKNNSSWTKMILPLTLVALVAVGGYFGYDYYKKNSSSSESNTPAPEITEIDTLSTQDTSSILPVTDTLKPSVADSFATSAPITDTNATAVQAPTTPQASGPAYNVAVLSYDNEASAAAKAKKLKDYGNNTSVQNSNGRFYVIINASHPFNDTTRLVDSLRKMYNPKGPVFIMK